MRKRTRDKLFKAFVRFEDIPKEEALKIKETCSKQVSWLKHYYRIFCKFRKQDVNVTLTFSPKEKRNG